MSELTPGVEIIACPDCRAPVVEAHEGAGERLLFDAEFHGDGDEDGTHEIDGCCLCCPDERTVVHVVASHRRLGHAGLLRVHACREPASA